MNYNRFMIGKGWRGDAPKYNFWLLFIEMITWLMTNSNLFLNKQFHKKAEFK